MNQRNIILTITGVVVLILIAGFWYMFSQVKSDDKVAEQTSNLNNLDDTTTPTTPVQTTQGISSKGTLGSLLSKGGNYTCTLTILSDDNSKTTSTIYASNGKTSFDFKIQDTEGLKTTSHTIRSGSWSYSWTDGQTKGVKTAITPKSSVPVAQPSGTVIMISDEAQIESDCHPWVPVPSLLTPPAGIKF